MFRMVNRSLTGLPQPDKALYFTSLRRIVLCGAGGSDDASTDPFNGGRSWYRNSHFQRSEGLDASSHELADMGLEKLNPDTP